MASFLALVGCGGGESSDDDDEYEEDFDDMLRYRLRFVGHQDDDNDGYIDRHEIDCQSPAFTYKEPLPQGTQPQWLVNEGTSYWQCEHGSKRYHSDGTVSGNWRRSEYREMLQFWNVCKVGTEPPSFGGRWVVTQDGSLCESSDMVPGIVSCSTIVSRLGGRIAITGHRLWFLHKGEIVGTAYDYDDYYDDDDDDYYDDYDDYYDYDDYDDDNTCYLRQQ